ncbi:MAG: hypothetical protein ACTH31_02570 [Pseudoclavibacter sp.]
MHPDSGDLPWWIWLFLAALVVGLIIRIIWVWRRGDFSQPEVSQEPDDKARAPTFPDVWERASVVPTARLTRPIDVPRPESVKEVAAWAGSEGFQRTELIYAPVFWVLLPLTALGFVIQQTIADPTGAGWSITINGEHVDSWPAWMLWLIWAGVIIWLVVAAGVLLLRLSILPDIRAENQWIFERSVAHSLHRASVDYDDGEASGWATYIALDHRLDDQRATRVHVAFEEWLSVSGLPPSGSGPISSATLFGTQAHGGYFFLHLPVSQTAGATTEHRWMLISDPRDEDGDVIVTPVPVGKQLRKLRAKLRRRAEKRVST